MATWSVLAGGRSTLRSKPMRSERVRDGKRMLLRELVLELPDGRYTAPAGFVTDYSSIPWWGAWFVHWSKVDLAGIVHDQLYAHGRMHDRVIRRHEADRVWREVAMAGTHRANTLQAWVGWGVLRLGGWLYWYPYRWGWLRPPEPGTIEHDDECCALRAALAAAGEAPACGVEMVAGAGVGPAVVERVVVDEAVSVATSEPGPTET
jgi:hypothetical protein